MDVWMWVQVYLLYLLAVAVHEMGHTLVGSLLGSRWQWVVVGPLKVSRESGPIRISYSRKPLSGYAMGFPCPRDTRARRAAGIAAGPLASLLLALVMTFTLLHLSPAQQGTYWQVTALGVISAFLFLFSVIPTTPNGHKNDAALLVQLWRDKEKWEDYYAHREERNAEQNRYLAVMELVKWSKEGRQPRNWDRATVQRAVFLRDGHDNEAIANHHAFCWAEDREDMEASGRFIARALELRSIVSETYHHWYVPDVAYYIAFRQGDASSARVLLTEVMGLPLPGGAEERARWQSMVLRAEAAVLLAEGKPDEARSKALEGLAALSDVKTVIDCGDRLMLERVLAACITPDEERTVASALTAEST